MTLNPQISPRNSAHLHALPIEQTYAEKEAGGTEKVLSGQLIRYQIFGNKVLPVQSQLLEAAQPLGNFQPSAVNGTFTQDSRYVERETVEAYNQHGQLLRVRQKNGVHASFQYGHNSTVPVMQALNATIPYADAPSQAVVAGDASYNGFESGHVLPLSADNQFWEYNSATTINPNPYAGRHCIRIAPGNPQYGPLRQLRPADQNQRFVFSAWVKVAAGGSARLVLHTKADQDANGPVFPAAAQAPAAYSSVAIPPTGGVWKYVEAWIDLEKVRQQGGIPAGTPLRLVAYVMNQGTSTPVFVDEMRIQPEMARLTTATYQPLVGLLSSSDANDYTTTFEYDGLQRLRLVRDHEGNIVRRLGYQYQGQAGAQHNALHEELPQQAVATEAQLDALSIGPKLRNMAYFDGLGRPLQQVQVGFAGGTGDLVTWVDHDQYGRIPKAWLPYVRPGNQGAYVAQPAAEQAAFYQAGGEVAVSSHPFALSTFEDAPTGRLLVQGAPGAAWQPGQGHTVETRHLVNTATLPVQRWVISGTDFVAPGLYPVGQLTATHIHGEDEEEVYEFKDKLGRLVHRKAKRWSGSTKTGGIQTEWLETFWIYDAWGNVACVIPPKAVAWMRANSNYSVNALPEDLCFKYVYDARQRLIEKHVPGKGWEYNIYDNLDRVILTQDEHGRALQQWRFTKYDVLGRAVLAGRYTDPVRTTRAAMQAHVDATQAAPAAWNHEARSAQTYTTRRGYTERAFPLAGAGLTLTLDMVMHHDDHDYNRDGVADIAAAADPDGEYSLALSTRLRDLPTGSETRVLPTAGVANAIDWLKSDRFYDSRLRQVHGVSRDHLGGQVLSYTEYDLVGKALRDKTMRQAAAGGSWLRLRQRYAYDAMGRITKVWQRVGTDPELLLSQSRYNALGQLVEKNLHSTNGTSFLQSVDYRHHIRGWLTQVNELVPSAATDITQRNAYISQVAATIVAADDQYGRPGLALSLELRHTDPNANPDLPAPSTLTWELPMLVGDPTSQTYKEYEVFLGQEFTVDFDAPEGPQPDLKTLALAPLQDTWARAGLQDAAGVLDKVISTAALDQSHWQATEPGDLFALRLDYELGNGKLKADPRHNGNISAVSWRSAGDGVVRGYGYTYDAIGRLTAARYAAHSPGSTKWDAEVGRYDVPQISYDQNGNLTQLTQHGWRPGTASFGMIDDLRYSYNGNQLQAVRDQSTQYGDKDFQDNGATSFQDYTYDARGSLTADANQGITAVTYNHLGLTETVTLTGGRQLRYLYAADGTRLARVRVQPGQADLRDDLVGAFAYQGGVLNHILNGEGRIVPAVSPGRQYRHEYHYRDQLGNLRLAFSDLDFDGMAEVSDILQEAHYYPYGLGFSGMAVVSNGVPSRYTFNGKEAQEAFGLQWMDFGARMYDAQVGRWMAVDGLAEKYIHASPFSAMGNNPIRNVDIDGNKFINFDSRGNYTGTTKDNWFHNFFRGNAGRVLNQDGKVVKEFRFADPENDVSDIESGEINKVIFVKDKSIRQMMTRSGAWDEENKASMSFSRYDFISEEGKGGGRLDFSFTSIPQEYSEASDQPDGNPSKVIFLVEDVAHNHMNFGNFLFGAAGQSMGFNLHELQLGAHYNSKRNSETNGYESQWDSPDDQFSIRKGFQYAEERGFHLHSFHLEIGPITTQKQ